MAELIDGKTYRGSHQANGELVTGILLPKGQAHEYPDERTLETGNGSGRYVNPDTLVLVSDDDAPVSVRAQVLRKAEEIVSKDRNSSYGEPEDNFARIAAFWNTFLGDKLKDGEEITSGETAALMILVKLAREMNSPTLDNKIDIAGYVACWAQVDHK